MALVANLVDGDSFASFFRNHVFNIVNICGLRSILTVIISVARLKLIFCLSKASFKNQRSDADTGHPLEMTCSVLKKPEGDTNTVRRIVGLVISV